MYLKNTYKFKHVPIKNIIIRKPLTMEQLPKQLPQIGEIWLFSKSQCTTIQKIS